MRGGNFNPGFNTGLRTGEIGESGECDAGVVSAAAVSLELPVFSAAGMSLTSSTGVKSATGSIFTDAGAAELGAAGGAFLSTTGLIGDAGRGMDSVLAVRTVVAGAAADGADSPRLSMQTSSLPNCKTSRTFSSSRPSIFAPIL